MKFILKSVIFSMIFLLGFAAQNAQTISRVRKIETKTEIPKFRDVVEKRLAGFGYQDASSGRMISKGIKLENVCPINTNLAAERVFYDYGAIFIADKSLRFPTKCIFPNESEVQTYQNASNPVTENIGGVQITLQKPAMEALLEARKEAMQKGLNITPRGGSTAGKRSFEDTYRFWNSRFFPALDYWTKRNKISRQDAEDAKTLPIQEQVAKVLEWEEKGFYFSKGFNKSILYSVAAPGASQHIFMLALDVTQYSNAQVREILAKHGWFQTVKSDLPHFTYLGREESDLPNHGLKAVTSDGYKFWIPNR